MSESHESKSVVVSTSTSPTTMSDWTRFLRGALQTPGDSSSRTPPSAERRSITTGKQIRYSLLAQATSLNALRPTQQSEPVIADSAAFIPEHESEVPLSKRAYPHIMDGAQPALTLTHHVLTESRSALDWFNDGDLQGLASSLRTIAVGCARIHPLTTFNESYGAAISYIRRACLLADPSEVDRSMLNGLIQSVSRLVDDPIIDLSSAADMLQALDENGWRGELDTAERFLALILEGSALENQAMEKL